MSPERRPVLHHDKNGVRIAERGGDPGQAQMAKFYLQAFGREELCPGPAALGRHVRRRDRTRHERRGRHAHLRGHPPRRDREGYRWRASSGSWNRDATMILIAFP